MKTRTVSPPLAILIGMVVLSTLGSAETSAQNSAPVVTNVAARQMAGTGLVEITYDVSDADGDSVTAMVICSSNNGGTFDLLPVTVSGDVHRAMAAGSGKRIIWNAAADYPGRYWSQVVAKVVVSDGPSTSGEMVFVPSGTFTMGSNLSPDEQPIDNLYTDAFYIDRYEVTNAEFEAFIDAGGYSTQAFWSAAGWAARNTYGWTQPAYWDASMPHSGPGWPGFPVVGVSWYEAEAYANFAGKRLPTEAEWEKAARGTDARMYPWGNAGPNGSLANYAASGDPYDDSTTPVGFYDGRLFPNPPFQTTNTPGPYGAYDQAGNVYEWVSDWYSPTYYSVHPSSNPPGPLSGTYKVMRGGSNRHDSSYLRCADRVTQSPVERFYYAGFRCVRTQ